MIWSISCDDIVFANNNHLDFLVVHLPGEPGHPIQGECASSGVSERLSNPFQREHKNETKS